MDRLPIWYERAEGAFLFLGPTALYFALAGNPWRYLLILFAIDLSILGYLAGPKIGAITYNAAHVLILPLICVTIGITSSNFQWLGSVGVVWVAHIGLDHLLGFGLKYPDSFQHTTLGMISRIPRKK